MTDSWLSLFQFAVSSGDCALAHLALQQGIPLEADFGGGQTALFLAAEAGHVDMVRMLLRAGARAGIYGSV